MHEKGHLGKRKRMKGTNRYIALAFGAFAYRPIEARDVVGVDDAMVIGAPLSVFSCGVGLRS